MRIEIHLKQNFSSTGLSSCASWERLLPYIEQAIGKKPNEEVTGLIVDKDGIRVQMEHK